MSLIDATFGIDELSCNSTFCGGATSNRCSRRNDLSSYWLCRNRRHSSRYYQYASYDCIENTFEAGPRARLMPAELVVKLSWAAFSFRRLLI